MRGGRRWADADDDTTDQKPVPVRPVSAPLGYSERTWTQCASCDRSFYLNTHGKPRRFCRDCYLSWSRRRFGPKPTWRKTTSSPATSSESGSIDGLQEPEADPGSLLAELERVVPKSTDVMELLLKTTPPAPPPPASRRPEMVSQGCQTGLAANTLECTRRRPAIVTTPLPLCP